MDSTTYPFYVSVTYKVNGKDAKRELNADKLVINFEIKK